MIMEITLLIMEKSWKNHGILFLNFCGNPVYEERVINKRNVPPLVHVCFFLGDLLIIMAQIIVSVQMVYEERVINKRNMPLCKVVNHSMFVSF